MTRNQIEYAKLKEDRRSNRAQEQLTSQRDTNTYTLGLATLDETKRANRAKEAENSKHNRNTEGLGWATLMETHRANVTDENERERNNRAVLSERNRAALVGEAETHQNNWNTYLLNSRAQKLTAEKQSDWKEVEQLKLAQRVAENNLRGREADIKQQEANIKQQQANIQQQDADTNRQAVQYQGIDTATRQYLAQSQLNVDASQIERNAQETALAKSKTDEKQVKVLKDVWNIVPDITTGAAKDVIKLLIK